MPEVILRIDGMHCGACVRRVSQALAGTQGIEVKEVRVGAARIASQQDSQGAERAIDALAKAGYPAHVEPTGIPLAGL